MRDKKPLLWSGLKKPLLWVLLLSILYFVLTSPVLADAPTDGLVVYYAFNHSGTTCPVDYSPDANDNSASCNNIANVGSYDSGLGGENGFVFDGSWSSPNGILTGTDTGISMASGQNFTFCSIIRPDALAEMYLFWSKGTGSDEFAIKRHQTSRKYEVQLDNNFCVSSSSYTHPDYVTAHVCWVFDNTGNTIKQYVNGSQHVSYSCTQEPVFTNMELEIGARNYQKNWNGLLQDTRFYFNKALSASEVNATFCADTGSCNVSEPEPETNSSEPVSSIVYPSDGSSFNHNWINISCLVTDADNTTLQAKIFGGGDLLATNNSVINNTAWTINITSLGYYTNDWVCQAYDGFNYVNSTAVSITLVNPSDDAQYLNYSSVVDRSVCENTVLNSDSVCFRTDNASVASQSSFRMLDINNPSQSFSSYNYQNTQAMHYLGSQFLTTDRDGVNLPVAGVGSMLTAQTPGVGNDYLDVATFGCRVPERVTRYEWRPDMTQIVCEGEVGDTPNQAIEVRSAAVSKYSYVLQGTFKCTNSAGCNASNSQSVRLEHEIDGNILPYAITYITNIAGSGYDGFKSENLDSASPWMGSDANVTLFIACNQSPDTYSISGRQGYLIWNLNYNEEISLNCTVVAAPEVDNIASLIQNPVGWIDNATKVVTDWFNLFNIPRSAAANLSHANMTRAIHHALFDAYYSTVSGYEGRTSKYDIPGVDYCPMSATSGYKGHWKWDGFFWALGASAAMKETPEAYKIIQDSFDCLFYYQAVSGKVPQNVRDTYLGSSTYQAPGGWDMVVQYLCNGRVTNTTWCSNAYEALALEHDWFRSTSDVDADNKFEWGGVASGWDDSVRFKISSGFPNVEALDLQGWMILQAEALLNLSFTYNPSDSTLYNTYLTDYKTAANNFWSSSLGNYYDHVRSTNYPVNDSDGPRLTPATGWMLLANVTNTTQAKAIYDTWNNNSLLGVSALNLGILPTLARNHDCFVDGETSANPSCATSDTAKWNGRNWAPVWSINYLGAKRMGNETAAALIRDNAMKQFLRLGTTQESFDSTDGSTPEEGSFAGTNFPGFGGLSYALLEYEFNPGFTSPEPINDTTPPVLSGVATQPSITQVQVTWQSDESVNCSINYGTTASLGTTQDRLTFGIGCGIILNDLLENTTYYFNVTSWDASGNNATLGGYNFTTQIDYPEEFVGWWEKYNRVDEAYRDGKGFLHWSIADMFYQEEPNYIESQILMFMATNNSDYLMNADYHLKNITDRYSSWGLTLDDFRLGHIAGSLAYFSYAAQNFGNTTLQARADYYVGFLEDTVLPLLEPYVVTFTYDGDSVTWLMGDSNTSTKPLNQVYGYAMAMIYMYNLTEDITYLNRARGFSNGYKATFSFDECHYNTGLQCFTAPYRYDFGQSWETFNNASFGFPPYDNQLNYGVQELEIFYRFWKHGFWNDSFTTKIANTLYYNMYLQEGGINNVLISRDWSYPSTSYGDYHTLDRGHSSMTFHYFEPLLPALGVIADQLRNDTYAWVTDNNEDYTFFTEAGYPYGNITDPRNNATSVYCSDDDYCRVKPDQVLKHIAASLYNASVQVLFTEPNPVFVDGVFFNTYDLSGANLSGITYYVNTTYDGAVINDSLVTQTIGYDATAYTTSSSNDWVILHEYEAGTTYYNGYPISLISFSGNRGGGYAGQAYIKLQYEYVNGTKINGSTYSVGTSSTYTYRTETPPSTQDIVSVTAFGMQNSPGLILPVTIKEATFNSEYAPPLNIYNNFGTYSITTVKDGYYNLTTTLSITQNDTYNITGMYANILTITAKDAITNDVITDFNLEANSSVYNISATTTSGSIVLPLVNNTNYTVTIVSGDYSSFNDTANITVTQASQEYEFRLYQNNSINIIIYNASDQVILDSQNTTIQIISNLTGVTNITSDGTFLISFLIPNIYELRFTTEGFKSTSRYVTVTDGSTETINVYLEPNSTANELQAFLVLETSGREVEGAIIRIQKEVIGGSLWLTTDERITDVNGRAYTYIEKNINKYYRFAVIYEGNPQILYPSNNYYTSKQSFISGVEETIELVINLDGTTTLENIYDAQYGLVSNLTYENNDTAVYEWVDGGNKISGARLLVKAKYTTNTSSEWETVSDETVEDFDGSISYELTPINHTIYWLQAYIIDANGQTLRHESYKTYGDGPIDHNTGLLFAVIIILAVVFLTMKYGPLISSVSGASMIFITNIFSLTTIPTQIITSIIALLIILFLRSRGGDSS